MMISHNKPADRLAGKQAERMAADINIAFPPQAYGRSNLTSRKVWNEVLHASMVPCRHDRMRSPL
jgi:hypothetical protein